MAKGVARMGLCGVFVTCFCLWVAGEKVKRLSAMDHILDDREPCKEICDNTYPLHTYPNPKHAECCKRGCRLFSIVELIGDNIDHNVNQTRDDCMASCMEAYSQTGDRYACNIGCASQLPYATEQKKPKAANTATKSPELVSDIFDGEDPNTGALLLTPLTRIHEAYKNMMGRVQQMLSVSWSFSFQQDDGKVVILQSEPELITEYLDMDDVEDKNQLGTDDVVAQPEDGAVEIFLLQAPSSESASSMGNSVSAGDGRGSGEAPSLGAVPDIYLYHQKKQEKAGSGDGAVSGAGTGTDSDNDNIPMRITVSAYSSEEVQPVDWLGCVSRKSGLPRWLLGLIIFFSAMVMVWLCFATTVTAPDQHVRPQVLSVYGDLETLDSFLGKVKIQPPTYEAKDLMEKAPPSVHGFSGRPPPHTEDEKDHDSDVTDDRAPILPAMPSSKADVLERV